MTCLRSQTFCKAKTVQKNAKIHTNSKLLTASINKAQICLLSSGLNPFSKTFGVLQIKIGNACNRYRRTLHAHFFDYNTFPALNVSCSVNTDRRTYC